MEETKFKPGDRVIYKGHQAIWQNRKGIVTDRKSRYGLEVPATTNVIFDLMPSKVLVLYTYNLLLLEETKETLDTEDTQMSINF